MRCKPILSSVVLLATLLAAVPAIAREDKVPWLSSLDQARDLAKKEDKLILIHFTASWCGPCKELERFVFVNPAAVRALATDVIPVLIDVDAHPEIASEYEVASVPVDVLVTASDHIVLRRSSPRDATGYLQMLADAAEQAAMLTPEAITAQSSLRQAAREAREAVAATQSGGPYPSSSDAEFAAFQTRNSLRPGGVSAPEFAAAPGAAAPENPSASVRNANDFRPDPVPDPSVTAPSFTTPDRQTAPLRNAGSAVTGGTNDFRPTGSSGVTPAIDGGDFMPAASGAESAATTAAASDTKTGGATESSAATAGGGSFMPASAADEASPARIVNQFAHRAANDSSAPGAMTGQFAAETASPAESQPGALAGSESSSGAFVAESSPAPDSEFAEPTADVSSPEFETAAASTSDQSLPPLGLDGYCGVTLVLEQKWTRGTPEFGCIHRGRLYLFASQECLEIFKMTPDMFSPLLGGADPVAWHETGELQDGARRFGVFYGDENEPSVIVLFANEENRDAFQKDPARFVQEVRQAMSRIDRDVLLR